MESHQLHLLVDLVHPTCHLPNSMKLQRNYEQYEKKIKHTSVINLDVLQSGIGRWIRMLGPWASEADVFGFVKLVLNDFFKKRLVSLFMIDKPNIWIVRAFGIPIGLVEVTTSATSKSLENPWLLGQTYDYLTRSDEGIYGKVPSICHFNYIRLMAHCAAPWQWWLCCRS